MSKQEETIYISQQTLRHEEQVVLAEGLRSLWEGAHGAPPNQVRVLVGPDIASAWIGDVLSPAERAATQQPEGQALVQQYVERLLATIQPDLQAQVEASTGRRTVSTSVRADVDTGHILCFFVLGEQLSPLTPCSERPPGVN